MMPRRLNTANVSHDLRQRLTRRVDRRVDFRFRMRRGNKPRLKLAWRQHHARIEHDLEKGRKAGSVAGDGVGVIFDLVAGVVHKKGCEHAAGALHTQRYADFLGGLGQTRFKTRAQRLQQFIRGLILK